MLYLYVCGIGFNTILNILTSILWKLLVCNFLLFYIRLFIFIIAGLQCSINFLLYSMVTQLHIQVYNLLCYSNSPFKINTAKYSNSSPYQPHSSMDQISLDSSWIQTNVFYWKSAEKHEFLCAHSPHTHTNAKSRAKDMWIIKYKIPTWRKNVMPHL